HNRSSRQQAFELLLGIRGEAQRQLAVHLDDRSPHAAAVPGEPGDQLLAGEAFRLLAPLGRDELLRAAGLLRQRAELGGVERLLDQIALFDRLLLAREKLPRLHAAGSAGLAVIADHGGHCTTERTPRRAPRLRDRSRAARPVGPVRSTTCP